MLVKGGTDFVVKDHHRDAWPWRAHKDWVRAACGIPEWKPRGRDFEAIRRKRARQNAKRRLERALRRKTPLRVSRPWEVEGISRTTWYTRGGRAGQVPPTPTKFPRGHPLTEDQRIRKPVNQETGTKEDMNTSAPGNPTKRERRFLLHHRDDGPIATMAGRVVAAELRRIEPRRLASVEKEGVAAAEAVAEKMGKLVKVHPSVGDDEMDLGRARYADAVPRLSIGRIHDEGEIYGAVDDEHRS